MYADPQSVTISGSAISLPRVASTAPTTRGQFTSSDGNTSLSVTQTGTNSRFRREIRLNMRKIAVDPISAANKEVSCSLIVAVDEPKVGFSDAELIAGLTALVTFVSASTYANASKLLGGEL